LIYLIRKHFVQGHSYHVIRWIALSALSPIAVAFVRPLRSPANSHSAQLDISIADESGLLVTSAGCS
jgi:hypothetical protein